MPHGDLRGVLGGSWAGRLTEPPLFVSGRTGLLNDAALGHPSCSPLDLTGHTQVEEGSVKLLREVGCSKGQNQDPCAHSTPDTEPFPPRGATWLGTQAFLGELGLNPAPADMLGDCELMTELTKPQFLYL